MTSFLGRLARRLAKVLERIGTYFSRLANLLEDLLPALLPPAELSRLTREQYFRDYASTYFTTIDLTTLHAEQDTLSSWEHEVLTRYGLRTGRMLVMGAGTGRESIGIARQGLSVVGIDSNFDALGIARRLAAFRGIPIQVNQGDFMALPYASNCFDSALLSSSMYSAIPGRAWRQVWLQELARVLAPGGLAIISFLPRQGAPGGVQALCDRLSRVLVKLPGANRAYQPGDNCTGEQFLHTFQSEEEVRGELADAGAIVRELAWNRGYAVVAFPVAHRR